MTALVDFKSPKPRFARSINVERDAGTDAIDGYLPVGRAIDAISRLAGALDQPGVEVALSVTGPYGSGKSSLAIIIDALLGPHGSTERRSAEDLLSATAPEALEKLRSARTRLGAEQFGFIRATATAQREPIAATVLRALFHGCERFEPPGRQAKALGRCKAKINELLIAYSGDKSIRPDTRDIRQAIESLSELAPVLLLIDEFGKNLEAFADSRSEADLYLLQELAEWTRGERGLPLALITMQHMAFDEYADGASAAQRREWAKIQGRFEDIPFVDSPAQTRALVAAAFTDSDPSIKSAIDVWARSEADTIGRLGFSELAADTTLLGACWPLHPLAVAVLPELCERYGQNERTLFSFLASREPKSVATFLTDTDWDGVSRVPVVRLDHVYDYFLESAATLVGVSNAASRWVEIDTRIRDAHGVSDEARRVLKTIGLLNLVSAGGTLRASRDLLSYVCVDGQEGTKTSGEVSACLAELESRGLITFRDFADEYRVWQGSDFDLKAAIDLARRRLRDEPADSILDRVLPLGPLVAARHSHVTGTLRAFARGWTSPNAESIDPLGATDREDGLALYVVGDTAPRGSVTRRTDEKPVAFVTTTDPSTLIDAAREVAAIDEVLGDSVDLDDDWVARRELHERRVEARGQLDRAFEATFGTTSDTRGQWSFVKRTKTRRTQILKSLSASQALSEIADHWYDKAPRVRNDLVNRHDLSSQAAKARRVMLAEMLDHVDVEAFGIDGHGPDNTLYRSVVQNYGLHRRNKDTGLWELSEPASASTVGPVWESLTELLQGATTDRLRVDDVYTELAAPPFGVRAGIAPVLLVTALQIHAEEVALYEHGTFRPVLTDDVLERLLRNPGNFEVKQFASRSGTRSELLTALADNLEIKASRGVRNGRVGSVLAVLSDLVLTINTLPEHIKKTKHLSDDTVAIRRSLMLATEPDELLFTAIPEALGHKRVPASGTYAKVHITDIAGRVADSIQELRSAYPSLLDEVRTTLLENLRGDGASLQARLAARAQEIESQVIDPRVKSLVAALVTDLPETDWLEYVAMNVTGPPMAAWTDDDRARFFTLIHDIGGTFRRIEALHAETRTGSDGFDAIRVTVTRPDGTENAKLVWIDDQRRSGMHEVLASALDSARQHTPSDAEARDLLLALLADHDLGIEAAVALGAPVTADPYDAGDGNEKAGTS